jgi:Beta-propeller repeat/Abnormal spindle-like microcephaly-assoc'd, ASPM-SPD-2-Hydin
MIKPIYGCTAVILAILAGAVLFRPHVLKSMPGSETATRSVVLREATPEQKIRLAENYGKLPLSFEANKGQTDGRVKFLSRGRGYGLFLTSSEAVLTLRHGKPKDQKFKDRINDSRLRGRDLESESLSVLRLELAGANPAIDVAGLEELPGKSNYFIGNDPNGWRTNVPNFAKVQYKDVYPGMDLIYYGNQGELEYDWVVRPGADLGAIQFSIGGAHQIRIGPQGDLVIQTEDGEVRFRKPVVYQQEVTIDSPQPTAKNENRNSRFETRNSSLITRQLLDGRYVLRGKGGVGFEVASYDRSTPLIIDPVLVYSTYLGGGGHDEGLGIAVDSAGNAYVTGTAGSTNFPVASPIQVAFGGLPNDAFVTKLNATGSALVYSTYLGGSGDDFGKGIVVDSSGNAYVTGGTGSTNFPTASPIQAAFGGGLYDAFVTKLNATGSALVYSTYLGGSGTEIGSGVTLDSAGNAYVTGSTSSTNFPTASPIQAAFGGGPNDAFVTKLNAAGSALVYSSYLGGGGDDGGGGIAVDSVGNAYVIGFTGSTNFPTASPIQAAFGGGNYDAFVTKLNAAGSALVYSTFLGGSNTDFGNGIAVDSSGNAYVAGNTVSTDFPTVNPFQATNHGFLDAFVAKLNAAGSAFVYSTYLGGAGDEFGWHIAVDSAGNAYLVGSTKSANFPTASPLQATYGAAITANAYVTKLNAAGSALIYSTYLGGSGATDFNSGASIAVDSVGDVYVTGVTTSTEFPTVNAFQPVIGGAAPNAFVGKISQVNLPGASLAPASLSFASQALTTASSARTVTLLDAGSAALNLSNIAATGDFAETNTCSTSVAGGANCTISVTFTPTAVGTRTGSLTVTDNAAGSPQTVSLSGTGADFSLAAATGANCPSGGNCSTSATISAGQNATYNLQVSPVSGFNGTVSLTCSGAPGPSTCTPSPASVPPNGSSSYAFTVTVSNTTDAMVLPWPTMPGIPGFPWPRGALLLLAGMAVVLFARSAYRTGRQTWRLMLGFAVFLLVLLSLNGCGGGGGGRPPTNATLTIIGSSGSVKHTLNLSLTINH